MHGLLLHLNALLCHVNTVMPRQHRFLAIHMLILCIYMQLHSSCLYTTPAANLALDMHKRAQNCLVLQALTAYTTQRELHACVYPSACTASLTSPAKSKNTSCFFFCSFALHAFALDPFFFFFDVFEMYLYVWLPLVEERFWIDYAAHVWLPVVVKCCRVDHAAHKQCQHTRRHSVCVEHEEWECNCNDRTCQDPKCPAKHDSHHQFMFLWCENVSMRTMLW
jgi:hypothetical protein